MPRPSEHRNRVDDALRDAGPREREALGRILKNPQFEQALDDLADDQGKRRDAGKDLKGFLKRKGVDLPDDVTVDIKPDNWCFIICLKYTSYCCTWDEARGWRCGFGMAC